jgi:hypothetical protein
MLKANSGSQEADRVNTSTEGIIPSQMMNQRGDGLMNKKKAIAPVVKAYHGWGTIWQCKELICQISMEKILETGYENARISLS